VNKALFSSKKEDWETPYKLFEELDQEFHFTLDACANEYNYKCANYFDEEENGLVQDWGGEIVYCNPPYGRKIYNWIKKASEESAKPNTIIVLLIPSRTDTRYFHEFLYNKNNVELRFLKGRVKFVGAEHSAPFPSLIAILKNNRESE